MGQKKNVMASKPRELESRMLRGKAGGELILVAYDEQEGAETKTYHQIILESGRSRIYLVENPKKHDPAKIENMYRPIRSVGAFLVAQEELVRAVPDDFGDDEPVRTLDDVDYPSDEDEDAADFADELADLGYGTSRNEDPYDDY